MQQVSKGIILCNIQFTIGVLIHRTPERTGQPYIFEITEEGFVKKVGFKPVVKKWDIPLI